MKFDLKKIEDELRNFWKANKEEMHYFLNGKEVHPEKVSQCAFQLKEVESSDEYNFEIISLNLRVQIDSIEEPYTAFFSIKVVPETTIDEKIPKEKIMEIRDNRITLRK